MYSSRDYLNPVDAGTLCIPTVRIDIAVWPFMTQLTDTSSESIDVELVSVEENWPPRANIASLVENPI